MLKTILERKNSHASYLQEKARETDPRSYRDPVVRTVLAANRIYKRRHQFRQTV